MKKYLWYQGGDLTGLNHQLDNLKTLVQDALVLGRTPVVDPPGLHPRHNFDHPVSTQWDKYIDITGIRARHAASGGGWEPAGEPADQGRVPVATARSLDKGILRAARVTAHTQAELGGFSNEVLILRNMEGVSGSLWANAALCPRNTYWIQLPPSRRVIDLAQPIIEGLGEYTAVHVRRGDRLDGNPGLVDATSTANIRKVLEPLVTAPMPVYILSDEREANFFDNLSPRFDIRRFHHWPALSHLVRSEEPDNFLLYEIEKRIFEAADIKVYTFRMDRRLHYLSDIEGWG